MVWPTLGSTTAEEQNRPRPDLGHKQKRFGQKITFAFTHRDQISSTHTGDLAASNLTFVGGNFPQLEKV